MGLIYKILRQEEWAHAQAAGVLRGSPDDLRDGFIHFSSGAQLQGTADKHFTTEKTLVLLAVDDAALGPDLRWEVSRGGQEFPHLYGGLALDRVVSVHTMARRADGRFVFPDDFI